MSKVTPEQIEKDHADLTNKTYKMEKLENLRKSLEDASDATVLNALGALRQLNPGRIHGLRSYATAVYNTLREEWLPDVDLPKLISDGVIYTGRAGGGDVFANLNGGTALVVKDAIAGLGEHGRWELRSDGSIMLSCKPSKAGIELVEDGEDTQLECRDAAGTLRVRVNLGGFSFQEQGQVYATGAMIEEGQVPSPYINTTPKKQRLINAETRVSQLEAQVVVLNEKLSNLASVVKGVVYSRDKEEGNGQDTHWNTAQTLPPVGCDLIINLPAGSYQFAAQEGLLNMTLDLDQPAPVRATRVCHIQSRGSDLTYQIVGDEYKGFQVKGQFAWTYP